MTENSKSLLQIEKDHLVQKILRFLSNTYFNFLELSLVQNIGQIKYNRIL